MRTCGQELKYNISCRIILESLLVSFKGPMNSYTFIPLPHLVWYPRNGRDLVIGLSLDKPTLS